MVDFKKLAVAAPKKLPNSFLETFNRLDRQVTHVELRPSQIKILGLMDARATSKDLVVKLNTGGGKTTIGLLYLKHKLDHLSQPVVYLVPTVQLVEQVVEEGRRIGFPVYHWSSGQSYPPEDALKGRGAIVCTYDKFFNGRSTFARNDVMLIPAAIVMDDVHAGIEAIRKCFACDIPGDAREELVDLLKADLQNINPSAWVGIEGQERRAVMEVPHWVLSTHLTAIRKILAKYAGSQEMTFAWPHLSPVLENCRLILSGIGAQLAIDPPPLERVPHYARAAHRLFMSASIHDGAVLIRELECDPVSAAHPVELGDESSVGERMVIVPSLINTDFSHEELRQVGLSIKDYANVVVLVPSFQDAAPWEAVGAVVATNQTIGEVIDKLKSLSKGQLVVFVQRYDGIDLPDTACRLLIIDGLPKGESILDRADLEIVGDVIGMRGKVANKIEQGLGRAVRSASDYCAVLLGGRDVAGFVSRSSVLENFSEQTVRQIEIGRDVSEALVDAPDRIKGVIDTVMQCLRRDVEWKDFYVGQMAADPQGSENIRINADRNREVARLEREAFSHADARDYTSASKLLQQAANYCSDDRPMRGILKQAAAKFLYEVDPVTGMQLQVSAYADNFRVSRPPMLLPVDVRRITSQAEAIASWLGSFKEKNGALIELDELRSKIAFANEWRDVEEAVRKLGELVGAESSRPDLEFKRGPDNLWVFGETAFVIEMKSEKAAALCKDDAEQLHSSVLWVSENVAKVSEFHPVMGTNSDRADDLGDFAFGAKLWAEVDFIAMIERLRRLVTSVTAQGPLFSTNAANIQKFLGPNELLPAQLSQLSRSIKQKK